MSGPQTPPAPRCAACARSTGDLTKSPMERLSRGPRSPPPPSPRSIARVRLSDNLARPQDAFELYGPRTSPSPRLVTRTRLSDNLARPASASDLYGFRSPPSPRPVVHRRLCDNLARNPDDVFALHGPRSAPSPRPVTRTRLSDNLERNALRHGPGSEPSPRPVARQRLSENLASGATVELREPRTSSSLGPITPKRPGENLTGDPAWGSRNTRTSTSTPFSSHTSTNSRVHTGRPPPELSHRPALASIGNGMMGTAKDRLVPAGVGNLQDRNRPLDSGAPRSTRPCIEPAPRPVDSPSSRDWDSMLLRLAAVPSRPLPQVPEDPVPADRIVSRVIRNSEIHRLVADVGGLEGAEEKAILKAISDTTIRRLSRFRRAAVVNSNIPEDVAYTRLPRGVVNRRALDEAGVQFVEIGVSVVLFRLLTRDETKLFVNRPWDIRGVVAVQPSKEDESAEQPEKAEWCEFLL